MKTFLALAWSSGKQSKAETYRYLMTILHTDPLTLPSHLNKAPESWAYEILARHFWKITTNNNGSFIIALPLAIQYICSVQGKSPETDTFIVLP
jgi:hypothetical protein